MSSRSEDIATFIGHLQGMGAVHPNIQPQVHPDRVELAFRVPSGTTLEAYFDTHGQRFLQASGFSEQEIASFKNPIQLASALPPDRTYSISIPIDVFAAKAEQQASRVLSQVGKTVAGNVVTFGMLLVPALPTLRPASAMPNHQMAHQLNVSNTDATGDSNTALSDDTSSIRSLNRGLSVYRSLPEAPQWVRWMGERASGIRNALKYLMFGMSMEHLDQLMNGRTADTPQANLQPNPSDPDMIARIAASIATTHGQSHYSPETVAQAEWLRPLSASQQKTQIPTTQIG